MAFKFNAILKFNGDGVARQIGKANRSFSTMTNSVKKASASIGKLGQGLKGLTLAGAPLTAGVALATKEFADFEKQMSVVKSLTGDISKKQFADMTAEAKRLGASTSFSAKEAGQGFEFLALAGFNAEEQISSLETVLNLAAAGSLELGAASDIATDSMSALAPAFDKNATKVQKLTELSDKFAFIQSKTNTNITQLGEAVKFGGGALAAAGIPLDDILVSMGALANAGLKGSLGGTALTNAFNKLAKPSKKAQELLDRFNIKVRDSNDDFRPLPDLLGDITQAMKDAGGGAERSAIAQEIFGVRGQRAINALANEGVDGFKRLQEGIKNSTGTAAKQAGERLDNLAGAFTIMKSAISGVLIETGGLVAGFLTQPIRDAADVVSNLAVGFQLVTGQIDRTSKSGEVFFKFFGEKRGKAILQFITGFVDGFKEVGNFVTDVGKKVVAFFSKWTEDSEGSTQSMGNLVAKIIAIGAIAAPILAALGAAFFVIGPILTGLSGVVGIVSSAFGFLWGALGLVGAALGFLFSPIGIIVAGLAAIGFAAFKAFGGFEGLKEAALTFGAGFMANIGPVIDLVKSELGPAFSEVGAAFSELFGVIFGQSSTAKNDLTSFGSSVANALGKIAKFIIPVVQGIAAIIAGITRFATAGVTKGIEIAKSIGGFFGFGKGETRVAGVAENAANSGTNIADAVQDSNSIQKEATGQKALVQPASAEQTARAVGNVINNNTVTTSGSGGGTTKVVLELRGDAGKILNKKVTEDQINNSFEQGREVKNKHQKRSNGLALAGGQ
jgi:TP901 family phage tail tape measure protein